MRAHFDESTISDDVRDEAIAMLEADRQEMKRQDLTPPGQAELIDLLRAVAELAPNGEGAKQVLEQLRGFAYRKHRES